MNRRANLRAVVEIGIMAAMALALSFVTIWQLPFGGRISLEMLPIFVLARFRGFKPASLAGLLFGVLDLFREPLIVHPVQLILDYPLPFASLGLAGLFPKSSFWDIPSCLAAGCVRFLCHFFSGMIFFGAYAPKGESVWLYSFLYNASYVVPSLLASLLLITPVVSALRHALAS